MQLILIPLLAALTQAATLIFHKIALSRRKIPLEHYMPLLFLFLTVFSTLLVPFFGSINAFEMLMPINIFYVSSIIVCGIIWNYLYFKAIKSETVNVVENIMSLSPLATIMLVGIFVPQKFDLQVGLAALVTTCSHRY